MYSYECTVRTRSHNSQSMSDQRLSREVHVGFCNQNPSNFGLGGDQQQNGHFK